MSRVALLVAALVGCAEELEVPASPEYGVLYFDGRNDSGLLPITTEMRIPVGGLRNFRLQGLWENRTFDATVEGGAFLVERVQGHVATVRAIAPGTATLRGFALDGTPLASLKIEAAQLRQISVVSLDRPMISENIPVGAGPFAWSPGEHTLGIVLRGPDIYPLFEDSLQVDLAGAERLSLNTLRIANAAPGTYPITVIAGGSTAERIDFVVADQADSLTVTPVSPTTLVPGQPATVCFEARADGRYIMQLPWTISVTGPVVTAVSGDRNCMTVKTIATSGTITVTAAAGGLSTSATLLIAP